jgi:sulfite oxidase
MAAALRNTEMEETRMYRSKHISPPADRVSEKESALQKDSALIVYEEHPLNVGTPTACARQTFLTPKERFFVRNHSSVPEVDLQSYRLSVTGMVESSLDLSLDELRAMFPEAEVPATLQCAGHRRRELAALQPIAGEIPWGADAISTATWRGVSLREVLLAAGIVPGARHVSFLGLDTMEQGAEPSGFGGSIPIEKALSAETLLAYEMNGEPLPPLHGFPLRVIVPGYIGARSVKWVTNIHVQAHPSTNYFQAHAYKLFPPHVQAEQVDWATGQMLGELPLNAVICHPQEGERLAAGPIRVEGYAITGTEGHIERVELSVDEGATWTSVTLLKPSPPWTWRFWEATLTLPAGTYQLAVRAWDSAGRTEPQDISQVWNWKGYLNHAWQRVTVEIQV